jgi:hypothetical protein
MLYLSNQSFSIFMTTTWCQLWLEAHGKCCYQFIEFLEPILQYFIIALPLFPNDPDETYGTRPSCKFLGKSIDTLRTAMSKLNNDLP